jgi:malic enzyme
MTMHIVGPWLSTNGKKKGKAKFKSADAAKNARQLTQEWQSIQKKWGIEQEVNKRKRAMTAEVYTPPAAYNPRGVTNKNIQSLNDNVTGAVSSKPAPVYTGTKVLGIGTMHKSNAVPIFSDDEATEISTMRR